ncbi:MAG: ABC transporter ATP-binding protein [Gammaproteobacteria bacterium]
MTAILEVRNLTKHFTSRSALPGRAKRVVRAVDDVSFQIAEGQTLGLVGESGCGKSTLGRAILRLHEPTSGQVLLDGEDVTAMDKTTLHASRSKMQMMFQDPFASLSPRRTVGQTLREPLQLHPFGSDAEHEARILELLDVVGLRASVLDRYPHEFSGGQRQRIGIARALVLKPRLIVADEPVSALDVSVQSQVLNLIKDLQAQFGIAFLFISHDLAVVQHVSDAVGVMYLGKLVEMAPADRLYTSPQHPYTQALLSAVPIPEPGAGSERTVLEGDVPSPLNLPSGCAFHTRCPQVMSTCREQSPAVTTLAADTAHHVRCHLHTDLE